MSRLPGQIASGTRVGDYVIALEVPARPGRVAYSARHVLLPRRARIQSVHPAAPGAAELAAQLLREACLLDALRHPGVPRVYECGTLEDRRPWMAIEQIDGPTVSTLLAEEGPLSVPAVLGMLADISEILHYAHARGCFHRNLRPEVIARRDEGPCILDWADAGGREPAALALPPPGSLAYQPPEIRAGGPADSRADVYALGAVAYEALAGELSPMPAVRRFSGAPPALTALIDRMLARAPIARPTAAEVRAEALAAILAIEAERGSAGARRPAEPVSLHDEIEVEEVELSVDLALDSEGDPEPPPPPSPPPRDPRLRWTPVPGFYRQSPRSPGASPEAARDATRTPAGSQPAHRLDPSARMRTEPMVRLAELTQTRTEPVPALPDTPRATPAPISPPGAGPPAVVIVKPRRKAP